ncbi:MAG: hypothetical protein ACYDGR_07390 [Candidatus Dormibacteria bacterium]
MTARLGAARPPEQPIVVMEAEVWLRSKRDLKLVAKNKVFKGNLTTRSEAGQKAEE